MSEAERVEPPKPHRCACVILDPGDEPCHCKNLVQDPDQPFCPDCTDRHPGRSGVITAVPASYYTQNKDKT